MSSLKFSAVPELCESKRCTFPEHSNLYGGDWIGFSSSASHISIRLFVDRKKVARVNLVRGCGLCADRREKSSRASFSEIRFSFVSGISKQYTSSHVRLKYIVVHGLEEIVGTETATESVEKSQSSKVDNAALVHMSLTAKNPVPDLKSLRANTAKDNVEQKSGRKMFRQSHGMKQAAKHEISQPFPRRNGQFFEYVRNHSAVQAVVSAIGPSSSVKLCNSVLKSLERSKDDKTMDFFEWMKSNGKLKRNNDAYHLAIRSLARKEDWCRAEMLLQEITSDSDCKLNVKVFNILIYVCSQKGLVVCGAKWFRMMLDRGVQPNIATFGMLMKLFQKGCNLTEAEFAFDQMRHCKLHCVNAYSGMITIYTRLGLYDKSTEVISLMENDKVLPNLENWLVRLNTYCQQGKLQEAESVFKSMLEAGISPNIVAYNTLITGYGKVSNPKAAELLFENLASMGLEPDETTYRSMVEGFGRNNNYKKALWYYQELKGSGFQPSSSNFYTMINLQARHGDDKGSVQTLDDMRVAGCQYSLILSSLLWAYERVGMIQKVPLILTASFYESILLDPTACSILVMSYLRNLLLDDARRILQDKRWDDPEFEDNLYHLLICSCKEAGNYETAVEIYTQMPKSEKRPNLHITASMISIYSAMNRYTDAENLYLKLKVSGITFDMVAYSIVVRMYIKAGLLKDACLVLDMMEKQKNIVPDTYLFRDMLRTYQQCGMLEKLASVYYWMLKSRVIWDAAMYNCVINCCGHALPVDELSRLFNDMIQHGYAANTNTFNVMLDVYGKAGLFVKAWKVFQMARKQGLTDTISYNTIIAAYGKSKNFKSMQYVVQKMQNAGYPVSLEAYNCMLDAYGKDNQLEEFNDVLQKMKEASCVSDHYTYNIMINIYGKKGWIEEVALALTELKEHGLEPDLYSYNTLIKAYGIAGMVEEAVNVVREMRMKGIKPDRVTYVSLITALQRNENFLEAVKWSLWMKQVGMG